ncbi:hypothetical protein T08_6657 [Trichinella sp. T8]|nr:hypothetical protein T08_15138 [Trichinella sp. T8]KRZ97935.1 hypothetical protein T08_13361 [Trichinella sp. T8]KRZ98148.1 hypothetical protein T08_6657 [Trichinella sp. T8]
MLNRLEHSRINLIDARSACYTLAVSNCCRKRHAHSIMNSNNVHKFQKLQNITVSEMQNAKKRNIQESDNFLRCDGDHFEAGSKVYQLPPIVAFDEHAPNYTTHH